MKLICDLADPAARVTADAGQQRQTLVRQLVTDAAAKPLIASCARRTCGACSHSLHPGLLWRHPVEVSGKMRNQRGAPAVFVLSGSAFSQPPPRSPRDGGNLMKDLHAPQDDLPTASLDYC